MSKLWQCWQPFLEALDIAPGQTGTEEEPSAATEFYVAAMSMDAEGASAEVKAAESDMLKEIGLDSAGLPFFA